MKVKKKKLIGIVAIITFISICVGYRLNRSDVKEQHVAGEIYLYGEIHGVVAILDKEFELWSSYYHNDGMRDLFVELPYYTAEYLNIWMQSDNDEILEKVYQDWERTNLHTSDIKNFYKKIKTECPETIFHGTDVGHNYNTTGKRFLEYLESTGQQKSMKYKLTKENIEQGKNYYIDCDGSYRENKLVENFIREYENLNGASIMGIYGAAHTDINKMGYETKTVPCLANQLNKKYGNRLNTKDLSILPERTDIIEINDKEYTASYFGKVDLTELGLGYQYREVWRVENAYDDFKSNPTVGSVLPYTNYPMKVEEKQVYVVEYVKTNGSRRREYHRSSGNTWEGIRVTEGFSIEE